MSLKTSSLRVIPKVNKLHLKILFLVFWLLLFFYIIFDNTVRDALYDFCDSNPVWAPLFLIIAQLLLASFGLPCSPLTLVAGVLWGPMLGLAYSVVATIIASFWTFLLGRHFLRGWISDKESGAWSNKIALLIDKHQWKASIIAYANPVFPGSSLGYLFGLSNISAKVFLIGAFVGTLPLQAMTTALGGALGEGGGEFDLRALIVIVSLSVLVAAYILCVPKLFARYQR